MNKSCLKKNLLKTQLLVFLFGIFTFFPAAQAQNIPRLFTASHLAPSPLTLPAGRGLLGNTTAVGITSFLQAEGEVIPLFYGVTQAGLKFSLLHTPSFALGGSLYYQSVNLQKISPLNPPVFWNTWIPGVHSVFLITPRLATFVSLSFLLSSINRSGWNTQSPFLSGNDVKADLAWLYLQKGRESQILATGISYNGVSSLFGIGLSHHWRRLHIGIHFFPKAKEQRLLPILVGGMAF